ncbi:MAG: hypothetical protein ACKOQU_05720, partial [Acidimicrobiaceae bacterium]
MKLISPTKKLSSLCFVAVLAFIGGQIAVIPIVAASNDPAFSSQWGLDVANIKEAQTISTGAGITVAVIDSGSGPNPDLTQNL